jgi:hypothetical protein
VEGPSSAKGEKGGYRRSERLRERERGRGAVGGSGAGAEDALFRQGGGLRDIDGGREKKGGEGAGEEQESAGGPGRDGRRGKCCGKEREGGYLSPCTAALLYPNDLS